MHVQQGDPKRSGVSHVRRSGHLDECCHHTNCQVGAEAQQPGNEKLPHCRIVSRSQNRPAVTRPRDGSRLLVRRGGKLDYHSSFNI